MPVIALPIFLGVNTAFFLLGVIGAVLILVLSSRHQFLVGYGEQQRRLRVYLSLICIALIMLGLTASLFNIIVG